MLPASPGSPASSGLPGTPPAPGTPTSAGTSTSAGSSPSAEPVVSRPNQANETTNPVFGGVGEGRSGGSGGSGKSGVAGGSRRPGLHGRWHALPLRVRLTVLIASLLVAGLGLAALTTVTVLARFLVEQVDHRLGASGVALAENALGTFPGSNDRGLPSDYYVAYAPLVGTTLAFVQNDTLQAHGSPNLPTLTIAEAVQRDRVPFTVSNAEGGAPWRVVLYPADTDTRQGVGVVAVALPLTEVKETIAQVSRLLLVSGMAIVAVGGLAGYGAVRRALRPLRDVEATAEAFAGGDFAQRVPAEPVSTEVGRLARSLNGMLAQIEAAFAARAASEARMRRFVADASHELRTPLSTVRGYGELYRMGAIGPDEVGPAMQRIESEAVRMSALVADLLQLAKLDEGRPLAHEPVDLRVLAGDAVADLRALDPTRTVTLVPLPTTPAPSVPLPAPSVPLPAPNAGLVGESEPMGRTTPRSAGVGGGGRGGADGADDGALLVRGDEGRLRQVVANLIGNVVQHTPAGTPVEIAVGRFAPDAAVTAAGPAGSPGAVVCLDVRDHGPGIPAEEAERVFERFYRMDASRARTSGGSGLGLAIVAAITAAHGGTMRVLPTPGGGTTVRLTLPAM